MVLPVVNVAIGILVNPDKEILIAKRPAQKSFAGFWEFPGGKIEAGETPSQALLRELYEELGMSLEPEALVLLGHAQYAYPHFLFRAPVFKCMQGRHAPRPLEGQKLAWVNPEDLFSYIPISDDFYGSPRFARDDEEGTSPLSSRGAPLGRRGNPEIFIRKEYQLLPACEDIISLYKQDAQRYTFNTT